jgi:hypothetical protein
MGNLKPQRLRLLQLVQPVLTDGAPTTPEGKLDSTDKILASCRTWNPLQRVVIHCIAIGRDLNVEFLQKLAATSTWHQWVSGNIDAGECHKSTAT